MSIRSKISAQLPAAFVPRARRLARSFDQALGWPLSPWRQGAVCMFHIGRCGSTVLGDLLNQHPRIRWDGEIYHAKWIENGLDFPPVNHPRFLRQHMYSAGRRFYGFEIKPHPEQQLLVANLSLRDYIKQVLLLGVTHFIILERRNYLRRMVSMWVGGQTKVRHISTNDKAELTKVSIDPDRISMGMIEREAPLLQRLSEIDQTYRTLEKELSSLRTLHLTYEDDISPDPTIGYRKVCEFLELGSYDARVGLDKTNPFALREIVTNYDELCSLLEGTRFEWMLE